MKNLRQGDSAIVTEITDSRQLDCNIVFPKLDLDNLFVMGMNDQGSIVDTDQYLMSPYFGECSSEAFSIQTTKGKATLSVNLTKAGRSGIHEIVISIFIDDGMLNSNGSGHVEVSDQHGALLHSHFPLESYKGNFIELGRFSYTYTTSKRYWKFIASHKTAEKNISQAQFFDLFRIKLVEDPNDPGSLSIASLDKTPYPGQEVRPIAPLYNTRKLKSITKNSIWQFPTNLQHFSLKMIQEKRGHWGVTSTGDDGEEHSYTPEIVCFLFDQNGKLCTNGTDGFVYVPEPQTAGIDFDDTGLLLNFDIRLHELPSDTSYLLFYYELHQSCPFHLSDLNIIFQCNWNIGKQKVRSALLDGKMFSKTKNNLFLAIFDVRNRRLHFLAQDTKNDIHGIYQAASDGTFPLLSLIGDSTSGAGTSSSQNASSQPQTANWPEPQDPWPPEETVEAEETPEPKPPVPAPTIERKEGYEFEIFADLPDIYEIVLPKSLHCDQPKAFHNNERLSIEQIQELGTQTKDMFEWKIIDKNINPYQIRVEFQLPNLNG